MRHWSRVAATVMIDGNKKLTPYAVKASLMYTAKLLAGYDPVTDKTAYYDPLTQGTGELNIVGAVELGKRIKRDTGFVGALPVSSLIAGEVSPWAGAVIPTIIVRPGLTWNSSLLWGGNTGLTVDQARTVWGSNLVWGGVGTGIPPPPPRTWDDSLVYGSNLVWGGVGTGIPPPPPRATADASALVWANNLVWGGVGTGIPPPPPRFADDSMVNANNLVWGGVGTGIPPPPPRESEDEVKASNLVWGGVGTGIPPPPPRESEEPKIVEPDPEPSPNP